MLTAGPSHVRIALSGGDALWLGHAVRVQMGEGPAVNVTEPRWYHEELREDTSLMRPISLAEACRMGGATHIAAMILASYAVLDRAVAARGAGNVLPAWYSRTVDAFSRDLLTVRQDLPERSGAVSLALLAAGSAFPLASDALRALGRECELGEESRDCGLS